MKKLIDTEQLDKLITEENKAVDSALNVKTTIICRLRALQEARALCADATPIIEALKEAHGYIRATGHKLSDSEKDVWDIKRKLSAALSLLENSKP